MKPREPILRRGSYKGMDWTITKNPEQTDHGSYVVMGKMHGKQYGLAADDFDTLELAIKRRADVEAQNETP